MEVGIGREIIRFTGMYGAKVGFGGASRSADDKGMANQRKGKTHMANARRGVRGSVCCVVSDPRRFVGLDSLGDTFVHILFGLLPKKKEFVCECLFRCPII